MRPSQTCRSQWPLKDVPRAAGGGLIVRNCGRFERGPWVLPMRGPGPGIIIGLPPWLRIRKKCKYMERVGRVLHSRFVRCSIFCTEMVSVEMHQSKLDNLQSSESFATRPGTTSGWRAPISAADDVSHFEALAAEADQAAALMEDKEDSLSGEKRVY